MTKLSIAAALILGASILAQAEDDLTRAFTEGKLEARIRMQYFNTNWDDNDGWNLGTVPNPSNTNTKPDGDSEGMAIGGSLIYKTAPFRGFSVGAGIYTTRGLSGMSDDNNGIYAGYAKNTTASDLFARGPGAATEYGQGYNVLAQAYLQYDIAKTSLKAGRLLMTNPWITPNDTKMIPIAIEGYEAVSHDIDNTMIQLDYADKIKERGMTYFGSMADTGDTPDAIKNYYRTHYTVTKAINDTLPNPDINNVQNLYGQDSAPAVVVLGAKNKSIDSLELQAWGMHWDDIIDQGMFEANYAFEAGDAIITLGGRYMQQFDQGAGDIIKPKDASSIYSAGAVTATSPTGGSSKVRFKGDSDNNVDTYMYALRAVTNYGPAKLLLAYSHTASGGDLIAPWRGFPTDGYTRSMTQTDWNANTKSYKAQFDYDFNALISGFSALVSYSYYNRDTTKVGYQGQTQRYYGNGDTHQWNIDGVYKVAGIKGLELKARYMIQNNDVVDTIAGNPTAGASEGIGNNTSNNELRLEANYRF